MRLGLAMPRQDGGRPLAADTLAEVARRIEGSGFDSAWVFDSLGRGFLLPDPLTTLSVAGTVTRRLDWAPACCRCRSAVRWIWPTASSPRIS